MSATAERRIVWRTPWTDRSGRFSWLKAVTFVAILLPGIWIAVVWATVGWGPRPINTVIHEIGQWAVRFLLLALAVTPARRILNWPRLIDIRRMLGLAALGYVLIHFTLYIVDLNLDLSKVASEIVLRFYLTIGFIALLGLGVMGITSTDGWIRRLGRRWNTLHRIVYPVAALALLHHFMQAKVTVDTAVLMTGFFLWLMFYRVLRRFVGAPGAIWLTVLAFAAGVGTAAIEVAWYGFATGVPPGRVFAANFDFSYTVRPAWWVLAAGLAVVALHFARPVLPARGGPRPTSAGTRAASAK
jgi:sulfoxide reductase heme-binding subunit YedZ